MRTKFAVTVLLLALGVAVAVTVTGQEEPLPTVQSRAITLEPAIVLAVEPIRTIPQPTLADAVRRNDYVAFHALYLETKPAEYRTLDELWTWAISDPIGAFYGRDLHDKLSRAYPGYASYIDEYKIVDSHGNVFYPTSETRMFLLERAISKEAPRTAVVQTAAKPRSAGVSPAVPTASRRRQTKPATSVAPPPVVVKAPGVVAHGGEDAAGTASGDAGAPQVVATPAPQPQVAQPQVAAAPQAPARTPNSGILLLVIGLIGVGLLAVILRTPREAQPTSILQPQAQAPDPKEEKKVEPIRRPSTEDSKLRGTGSHG